MMQLIVGDIGEALDTASVDRLQPVPPGDHRPPPLGKGGEPGALATIRSDVPDKGEQMVH
jgi:hypothetical protein